ncbi:hypothetical protein H257_14148, partial [Aphanomyces astaci]
VSYATFVWGEKLYDDIQRLTFSLTNFHASLLPLRLEDHDSYRALNVATCSAERKDLLPVQHVLIA